MHAAMHVSAYDALDHKAERAEIMYLMASKKFENVEHELNVRYL